MYLQCQQTQIRQRYSAKYFDLQLLRNWIMRDWESLRVLALGYDSLIGMKPVQSCLYQDCKNMTWTFKLLDLMKI